MKIKYKILLAITPAVFLLDQLTKGAILLWVDLGTRHPVIPGFFDIVHFRNTGAAFGMFAGAGADFRVPFFYAVAVVATIALGFYYRSLKDEERLVPVALALIFGGMAGNVIDRIRLGSVVDFLSVHFGDRAIDVTLFGKARHVVLEWPAFNVADSAITIAMVLLVISAIRHPLRGEEA